jgi:hypothetical protein
MNKKIKNLFDKEQMLELNLHNCNHQLGLYLEKLKQIKVENKLDAEQKIQLKHFNEIFKYYKKDLIPALEEILKMDAKHLKLIKKNPDPKFRPVEIEFTNHEKMIKEFFHRFESIHKEFYGLTVQIKNYSTVVD